MKKSISIFIISLFLVGLVIAAETEEQGTTETSQVNTDDQSIQGEKSPETPEEKAARLINILLTDEQQAELETLPKDPLEAIAFVARQRFNQQQVKEE